MNTQPTGRKPVHGIGELNVAGRFNSGLCFLRLIMHCGSRTPPKSVLGSGGCQHGCLLSLFSGFPLFQFVEIESAILYLSPKIPERPVVLKCFKNLPPAGVFIGRHETDKIPPGQSQLSTGVVQSGYIPHLPAGRRFALWSAGSLAFQQPLYRCLDPGCP